MEFIAKGSNEKGKDRLRRFENEIITVLEKNYRVELQSFAKYRIFNTKHGFIDYFPLKDTLYVREEGKVVKKGFKWIIENLIECKDEIN